MNKKDKIKVLFVCVHNAARSQMAESYLNNLMPEKFEAKSAGLEPGQINPLVVEVLKEDGIDISENETKSVFDFYKKGKFFKYVITVCDEASAQKCPTFPGVAKKLHWNFKDPSKFEGTYEERLEKTRKIRDQIKNKIKDWVKNIS
jgi:arsenate reductase